MDAAISKILSQVYELEGLLLVIDKHGDETPAVVYDLVRRHAATIGEMSQLLTAPEPAPAPVVQPPAFAQPVDEPAPEEPVVPQEPAAEDTLVPDAGGIDDEPAVQCADDEPQEVFTFDMPAADTAIDAPAVTQAPPAMRVDEKLQRSMSKDMRKAFSLNDYFRFRRELFGNSEADFDEALNMVESMNSYGEAADYFLADLGWDETVPEVKEFLNIVRHHFDE